MVAIFEFKNGMVVVGEVPDETMEEIRMGHCHTLEIKNPLRISQKEQADGLVLAFLPYYVFAEVKQTISVAKKDIFTVLKPTKEFAKEYVNDLERIKTVISAGSSGIILPNTTVN